MVSSNRTEIALRSVATGLGLAMLSAALFADGLGLPRLEDFGATQFFAMLCGLALMGVGVLGRRIVGVHRGLAMFLLNCVLAFSALELVASLVPSQTVAPREFPRSPSADLSYYRAQPWGEEFWQEHVRQNLRLSAYEPYLVWRRPPFDGDHIDIDQAGYRATPQSGCVDSASSVFFLGGSAAWGWGAPDWATIPASLAELLSSPDDPTCVANLAQNAFVSTQELIELVVQLQRGNVPDRVIFYDGFNDAHAAFELGVAGSHYQAGRISRAMAGGSEPDQRSPLAQLAERTQTARIMRRLLPTSSPPATGSRVGPVVLRGDVDQLANEVVDVYVHNYEVVEALARRYGFEFDFFWQPAIDQGRKELTTEESAMLRDASVVDALPLISAVYQRIAVEAGRRTHLHDLTGVFDQVDSLVWIDFVHTTPVGNRVVAQTMAEILRDDP